MRAFSLSLRLAAGRIGLVAALALVGAHLRADDSANPGGADAFPTFESYIKVSGQAPWISGDSAAYASRAQQTPTGSFGIQDLYYTKNLSDDTTVVVNGRAMGGTDDYLASVNVSDDNLGSLEAGYKRFRIFYDGVGGFFPLADQFQAMSSQHLSVDRSAFWVSAKLARPGAPVFTLNFRDEIRTGEKDSTIWAAIINPDATVSKGALVGTAAPANTPFLNPNLLQLAEHHDILDGSMVATVGKTTETLTATLDWVSNVDTRYYVKYPGSIVTADPAVGVLDDQEAVKSRSFRLADRTETEITDRLTLEAGLSYLHLSGEDGGVWITPTYSSTAKAFFPAMTAGDIAADARMDDTVGNLDLIFTPNPNWRAQVGIRDEYNVIGDAGGFITTSLASNATSLASTFVTTAQDVTYSHEADHVATPEASIEYHGFNRLSLYATFQERVTHGGQHWINPYAATTTTGAGVVTTATAPIGSVFFQEANQDYDDAKLGASWEPNSTVTIRADVFQRDHENRFIGADDLVGTGSAGALYATGMIFTGVDASVVWQPFPAWSFNTRYQPQSGEMSVTGNAVNGGNGTEITSGKARSQMISETVDWTPVKQFYAEGSLSLVYDELQTAYPAVIVSATAPVQSPIVNANNNYVTGSVLLGFVVDKRTDAQVQGVWQQASDYNPQVALGGQPYGAAFLYESLTLGLKHKFNPRLFGDAKAGYLRSTDGTTGGFTNYRGPLAYVALEYQL